MKKPALKGKPKTGKAQSVKGKMPQFYDVTSKKPEPDDRAAPSRRARNQRLLGVRL